MSAARTAGVVVLGILLTTTLLVGNVVFAAHGTVLDPDYVTETVESEGGYEPLVSGRLGALAGGSATTGSLSVDGAALSQSAVTDEYLDSQGDANVERLYAYLHGNSAELNLSLDMRPLAANVGEEAAADVRERAPGDLAAAALDGSASESSLVTVDTVRRLDDGPDEYESAREEFRTNVRDRVVAEMVDEAFAGASNDELLALVIDDYNPNDYTEAEKGRMVADRESAIRAALADQIRSDRADDVDSRVGDALGQVRENATAGPALSEGNQEMVDAAAALRTTTVDALTTDMTYDTYRQEATAARDDLAAGVGAYTETQVIEQAGQQVSLSEEMPAEQRQALDRAATQVQRLDLLAVVLPVLALVFLGLVAGVSRSAGRTGGTAGWAMLLAGVPTYLAAGRLNAMAAETVAPQGGTEPAPALLLGLLDGFVGRLQTQSLVLAGVGLTLALVALALRYDLHEG